MGDFLSQEFCLNLKYLVDLPYSYYDQYSIDHQFDINDLPMIELAKYLGFSVKKSTNGSYVNGNTIYLINKHHWLHELGHAVFYSMSINKTSSLALDGSDISKRIWFKRLLNNPSDNDEDYSKFVIDQANEMHTNNYAGEEVLAESFGLYFSKQYEEYTLSDDRRAAYIGGWSSASRIYVLDYVIKTLNDMLSYINTSAARLHLESAKFFRNTN